MKKNSLLLSFFLLVKTITSAQSTISGYVYDAQNREPLIGAIVFDSLSKTGTIANEFGYYRLSLKKQNCVLRVSYVGYAVQNVPFSNLRKDTLLTFFLDPSVSLTTLTVTGNQDNNIETIQAGKVNISLERLQNIPSIGGERDLLKALSVLPGVANGAEGTSSLLVRGGGQDQNLFILDGANTYNTGHLLNFISIFNPDALKKVDFYKGGFPARFGGRLSSVVDVTFRDGNKKHFEGKIDVGLINSKLTLEGPIGKNSKTSYLFAARSTYLDVAQFLIGNSATAVRRGRRESFTGYTFYDINAKISHEFNDKNKIYVSYYEGLDLLRFVQKPQYVREYTDFQNSIVNRALSLKYYKIITPKLSMNAGLNYTINKGVTKNNVLSQYDFTSTNEPINDETDYKAGNFLEDYNAYLRFDYSPNTQHFFRFGAETTLHQYKTNESSLQTRRYIGDSTLFSNQTNLNAPILRGYESAIYVEDDITLTKNWVVNIGLRGSFFRHNKEDLSNIEPRLSMRYTLPHLFTINLTAAQTVQYNHALLTNEIGADKLVWVPSSNNLAPEKANQIAFGVAKQFKNVGIDVSVEGYYKKMKNLSQFFFFDDFSNEIYQNWQQNTLRNGRGEAYGLEFLVNKTEGKFNGLLSYTLSWNNRQFEGLNEGRVFPFKYDRRHIFNTYGTYQLSKKWKVGFLWTYNSGFRITIPNGQLANVPFFNDNKLLYTAINNGKMPDYHRLDLNAIQQKTLKNGRIRTWSFNLYNAYARLNPIYIYVQKEYKNPKTQQVIVPNQIKGSVLLPILPSVNYGLKF
jgi:hypothetical protein